VALRTLKSEAATEQVLRTEMQRLLGSKCAGYYAPAA
jgi:hypothetical protein